jgi:hypothetical protein
VGLPDDPADALVFLLEQYLEDGQIKVCSSTEVTRRGLQGQLCESWATTRRNWSLILASPMGYRES